MTYRELENTREVRKKGRAQNVAQIYLAFSIPES